MKTSELTGTALDWAVAKCEKLDMFIDIDYPNKWGVYVSFNDDYADVNYTPHESWGWAGPIIERESINTCRLNDLIKLNNNDEPIKNWCAHIDGIYTQHGPTPMIAAMRCYVASKMGDEIEIPKELK